MRIVPVCVLLLVALLPTSWLHAGDEAASPAKKQRIAALIDGLAELESWQGGILGRADGHVGFAPAGAGYQAAYRELVALGPEALPSLLAHLDDRRETKLEIEHEDGFGGIYLGLELEANPTSSAEIRAIRAAIPHFEPYAEDGFGHEHGWAGGAPRIDRHVVTVGDACFAILGEITNRVYEPVRYQPTFMFVVNSPTRCPELVRAVRAQWAGKDHRQELWRRLWQDFHTPRTGASRTDFGWLQAGALRRLLEYDFQGNVPRIQALLAGLSEEDVAQGRVPGSGLSLLDLLRLLRHRQVPGTDEALAPHLLHARDPALLVHLLTTMPERRDAVLLAHIRDAIHRASRAEPSFASGNRAVQDLLRVIGERWPERETEVLVGHFRERGFDGAVDLVAVAYGRDVGIPLDIWAFLLDVRRTEGAPKGLRICDVAALQIARQREDLPFNETADEATREARIQRMRQVLADEGLR